MDLDLKRGKEKLPKMKLKRENNEKKQYARVIGQYQTV